MWMMQLKRLERTVEFSALDNKKIYLEELVLPSSYLPIFLMNCLTRKNEYASYFALLEEQCFRWLTVVAVSILLIRIHMLTVAPLLPV